MQGHKVIKRVEFNAKQLSTPFDFQGIPMKKTSLKLPTNVRIYAQNNPAA